MRMLTDVLDDANRKIAALESQLTAIQGERDAALAQLRGVGIVPYLDRMKQLAERADAWQQRAEHAEGERDGLRAKARALVEKLNAATPHIDTLAMLAHVHGMPYSGPTYGVELEALEATLHPGEE